MLNSVSFSPSFSGVKIAPTGRGCVIVGGKLHPVIKVPDNNPLKASLVQEYREVVFLNGKMYPVKEIRSYAGAKPTDVVEIDGKTYRVNKNLF